MREGIVRRLIPAIWLALILLSISAAQATNQAALVIRFGDDLVETYCVSFSEPEITGRELLVRAGLALELDQVGMGATVCSLNDVGCPSTNCFCECRGGSCTYWSYWQMADDGWRYAVVGASVSQVQHGDLQGWSWGPGSVTEAIPPPHVTFDAICGDDATSDATATGTLDRGVDATLASDPGPAQATSVPAVGEESVVPGSYAYLGLFVLLLGGLALLASRRRRR